MDKFVRAQRRVTELVRLLGADHGQLCGIKKADLRGNPSGGRPGSRHRQQLNGEFIAALLRDFRHGGPAAIAKVRKNQPAVYCKLLTLLCPRDVKVEHSGGVKAMSDEEIEQAIEAIQD